MGPAFKNGEWNKGYKDRWRHIWNVGTLHHFCKIVYYNLNFECLDETNRDKSKEGIAIFQIKIVDRN